MASRTYGILWRWHFLAGLAACPVILVLAVTGAAYVFQPELETAVYADLREVTPRGERKPLDELVASFPADCRPGWMDVPTRPAMPVRVWCPGDGKPSAFVDPYTGAYLGREVWDDTVFGLLLKIHWELLLGERGRLVVEWATSWTIVLLFSGAYLWWPSRRRGGKWWPRQGVAPRQKLRDLHAVFGAYMVPALFILSATGLFWTRLAGEERWAKIASDSADEVWEKQPASTVPPGATPAARIGYDRALVAAGYDIRTDDIGLSISINDRPDAAYLIYATDLDHAAPWRAEIRFVDAYGGTLLQTTGWDDRSLLNKIGQSGYSIHVGAIAGWPGRILALVAALVLAALTITGPWMWWKRRPRGKLGVPPRAQRFAWPLIAGIGGLGWLMPTVGYTLLAIAAFELGFVVVRRLLTRRVFATAWIRPAPRDPDRPARRGR